jgi:peptidyl-prolyl cis-trans isomerase C
MRNMSRRIVFASLAAATVVALALASCSPGGRTLATVAGHTITAADLEDAARQQPGAGLDPSPAAKRHLLDDLIDRALLVNEARRLGLDKGAEYQTTKTQIEDGVLPEVLYRRVVSGRVRVSDAEVKAVWNAQDKEIGLSQIFTTSQRDAEAAAARLAAGDSFAVVARRMSRDHASAAVGGALGYAHAGQLPQEMEDAVRDLPVGKWTKPIQTPMGWYIVQVTDRRPRQREPFEQAKGDIAEMLRQRKERPLVLDYMARLKRRYHLERDLAGFDVLARKWQNRTAEELVASGGELAKLGLTDADLATPLVRYQGGAYTVRDFFNDFAQRSALDRPPAQDDPTLGMFVEDRASLPLLLKDARARGLAKEPETERLVRQREESYLITRLYEQVVVPAAQPAPGELDSLRAATLGGKKPTPELEAQISRLEASYYQNKRRRTLDELIARLRKSHPPQVDEKALAGVPWPVPPKENA